MQNKIIEIFKKYNIELEKEEIEKFEKFLELFVEKNSKINLSAIREKDDIILKHFLDSIILNIFLDFAPWEKVADLWTWWWFPMIPLAIINPETIFVWIDSVWKKVKAVNEFIEKLDLKNASAIGGRAEELGQNEQYREKFDFVVSRATAYFPVLLEYAIPLLKVWWMLCAYKLQDKEELNSIKKALKKLKAKIHKIKNYKIENQERVIIFIEKLEKTPSKYPRKIWVPMAKPL